MKRKELLEKRNDLIDKMQGIIDLATKEERGLTDEEKAEFDNCEAEVVKIKDVIDRMDRAGGLERDLEPEVSDDITTFANMVRGIANISKSDGAAAIPTTVAQKIVARIAELSPIYARATKYNAKGTLVIPYVDTESSTLAMAYVTEGSVTATAEKLASVQLTGQLAGVLTLISKSLLNNTDIALTDHVVNEVAKACAIFIEKECIKGSTNCPGLTGVETTVNAAATALTLDNLIACQDSIVDAAQANACWIVSRATKTAIRQLKDGSNRPLLEPNVSAGYGEMLLGRPIYVSENMDGIGTGKTSVYYGDFSGLAILMPEDMNTEILYERFADQHQIGVVAFAEFNAKVENQQFLAKIKHA